MRIPIQKRYLDLKLHEELRKIWIRLRQRLRKLQRG